MPLGFLHRLAGKEVLQRGRHLQHDVLDPPDLSVRDQRTGLVGPILEVPAVGHYHLLACGVGLATRSRASAAVVANGFSTSR